MKIEDNGVTFDFSSVALREIKVEDEDIGAVINVDFTSNISFVTTRHDTMASLISVRPRRVVISVSAISMPFSSVWRIMASLLQ